MLWNIMWSASQPVACVTDLGKLAQAYTKGEINVKTPHQKTSTRQPLLSPRYWFWQMQEMPPLGEEIR